MIPAWNTVEEMLRQRLFSLALGYEDLKDQEELRKDPMLRLMAGKKDPDRNLAGKSTLNRLELGTGMASATRRSTSGAKRWTNSCWICLWRASTNRRPKNWCSTSTPPICRYMEGRKDGSSTTITDTTVTCRYTS